MRSNGKAVVLSLPISPILKARIEKEADAQQLPMNEIVANILAEQLNCPKGREIPRKSFGRPRKGDEDETVT